MARVDDVITYLEMREKPALAPVPTPAGKLALLRAEHCTASFYRYLYDTVGEPCLWFERRLLDRAALLAEIRRPGIEIFVLYVGGVPAGYFELDAAPPSETELCYFGLVPDFIGRGLGRYLLQAAIERAWSRPIARLWVHTSPFDHPRALPLYQRMGFVAYRRREVSYQDPRETGALPRTVQHRLLPPLE